MSLFICLNSAICDRRLDIIVGIIGLGYPYIYVRINLAYADADQSLSDCSGRLPSMCCAARSLPLCLRICQCPVLCPRNL